MTVPVLELPIVQNWSCHSCSGCCRQHAIGITDEEKLRIETQGWTTADGTPEGAGLFRRSGRWPWNRGWRLAHQEDGACVFLDDQGLCRIHAKFGEAAKPLACRIYPYAFHPKGDRITISLRFSCPSVVENKGRGVVLQRGELLEIARQVVPANATLIPPPPLGRGTRLDWPETLSVVEMIDRCLWPSFGSDRVGGSERSTERGGGESTGVIIRLIRILHWLQLLERARLRDIRGERLAELVQLLAEGAVDDYPSHYDLSLEQPVSRVGSMMFRLLAGQYAREDRETTGGGLRDRWRLFKTAIRLAWGGGHLPVVRGGEEAVSFSALDEPGFGLPMEADEILTRFLQVKVRGMHFCGRGFYDVPLVEGFQSLALMVASVLWQSRWRALREGRRSITRSDVAESLAVADHQHGYAEIFGTFGFRGRSKALASLGDVSRLLARYGQ